jgi:predicted RNA-binding Zn ribbon-like protein
MFEGEKPLGTPDWITNVADGQERNETLGPTRRGGPLFRWLGEPLALDLANTLMVVRPGATLDLLETSDQLARWLEAERPRLDDGQIAARDLGTIRVLRDAIHRLFTATVEAAPLPDSEVALLNTASAAVSHYLELDAGGQREPAMVERDSSADPLARVLGRIARSAIELLAGPDRARLRICHAPSCGMFFLAARRGQAWCSPACGNRARVARHYARRRARGKS